MKLWEAFHSKGIQVINQSEKFKFCEVLQAQLMKQSFQFILYFSGDVLFRHFLSIINWSPESLNDSQERARNIPSICKSNFLTCWQNKKFFRK